MASTIYVEFTSASETAIANIYANPQPNTTANQGTITTADSRYSTFYNAQPAVFQALLIAPGS